MDILEIELDLDDISEIADLAVDKQGAFFVTDEFNHRILKFSAEGQRLLSFGQLGRQTGDFHYPRGLAIDNDRLFVADSWNHRIQIFDLDGNYQASFGSLGDGENQLQTPLDIKLDPSGSPWVTDSDNHRVLCFDADSHVLKKCFKGGHRGHGQTLLNEGGQATQLSLYYPNQILFHNEIAYVQDAEKLVRLDSWLIEDFFFDKPRPRCALLSASHHKLVAYDPDQGEAVLYNFGHFRSLDLFSVREKPRGLFNRGGRLWFFGQRHLIRFEMPQPEAFLEGAVSSPAWDPHPLAEEVCRRHLSAGDVVNQLSAHRVETVADFLFKELPHIFECLDALQTSEVCFLTQGSKPLSQLQPLTKPLMVDLLNGKGGEIADRLESYFYDLSKHETRLVGRLASLLSDLSAKQRLDFCAKLAPCFSGLFSQIYAYRNRLLADLRQRLGDDVDEAAIRRIDGALFFLDRLSMVGFRILGHFRISLQKLEILEEMAAFSIPAFLAARRPDNFYEFEPHLLNCLHRLDARRFPFPDTANEALSRHAWAMEGAAACAAQLLLAREEKQRQNLAARQLGYSLCSYAGPVYRHQGRLHWACASLYQLGNQFHFPLEDRTAVQITSLFDDVPYGAVYHSPVFKDAPIFRTRYPDWRMVSLLEKDGLDRNDDHPYYVAAVVQWAYNLALQDSPAEALALLEKIKGAPYYASTQAMIYASMGDFDKAIAACLTGDAMFWPLSLCTGIIRLYRGEWEAAIKLFAKPAPTFPAQLAALYLAIAHRSARHFNEALSCFEKIQDTLLLPYHRGITYRLMGRDREALACFAQQTANYPFRANQIETLLTLRKLARYEQYDKARAELPEAAFLRWNHERFGPRHDDFTQTVDAYLKVEASPLPQSKRERLASYWVSQSQNLTPMFFVLQVDQFKDCQADCPFDVIPQIVIQHRTGEF